MGTFVISTVVNQASSYDLVTLADMHLELNIPNTDTTKDAFLSAKITEASSAVQEYCNRVFVQEGLQDVFMPDRADIPLASIGYQARLTLSRFPVASVTALSITPADGGPPVAYTAGTDFQVNQRTGELLALDSYGMPSQWAPLPTTVAYTAGYTAIPGGIIGVVKQMVTRALQQRGRDPFLKATDQAGGVGRREYWVPNSGTPQGQFSPDMLDVLNSYRVPVVP